MKFEFSAGGIVFKKQSNQTLILVAQHSQHHGWVFPKGLIGDNIKGEKKEDTAIREVEEETGIKAKILNSLTPVTYWYVWDKEKIEKTVYYFLMKYLSGDTTEHDEEMEQVEWIPNTDVEKRLSYKSDKDAWREAEKILNLQ